MGLRPTTRGAGEELDPRHLRRAESSTRADPLIRAYVASVSLVGIPIFALAAWFCWHHLGSYTRSLWLLAPFLIATELVTIKVSRGGEQDEITTSTTFAFALLLTSGPVAAIAVQGIACLVADTYRRKPWWKAAFNTAQLSIALFLSGNVLARLTGQSRGLLQDLTAAKLLGILVAAFVFFAVNNGLTGIALALAQKISIIESLMDDFWFQVSSTGVLLALAPILVAAAENDPLLVPLISFPLAAVYQGGKQIVLNEHRALHDPLCDLPNRKLLAIKIEHAIKEGVDPDRNLGVVLIDLDHFKDVNDTLGHRSGDLLLIEVGRRLKNLIREDDVIARFGGDEFAVLLTDVAGGEDAQGVAERIMEAFAEPFEIEEVSLVVGASAGVALFPSHGQDVTELLSSADIAMYSAKNSQSGVALSSPTHREMISRRLYLAEQLREAVNQDGLEVHYQPELDLSVERPVRLEALARWHHDELGWISPEEFIGLAEHTTLIGPLDALILKKAITACAEWNRNGFRVGVSVNMSAHNLLDPNVTARVARLLTEQELAPDLLTLEVTESAMMSDPARAASTLGRLNDLGVRISVDDFGTGYSSLSYLRQLPVDELKIDRSFLLDMDPAENDFVIIRSVIDLARNLGLDVVAEGIERTEMIEVLLGDGCRFGQGFGITKPLAEGDVPSYLSRTMIRHSDAPLDRLPQGSDRHRSSRNVQASIEGIDSDVFPPRAYDLARPATSQIAGSAVSALEV